jgi:DeoR/GlpR family transcriptional regulator of sugar metabolism
MFRRVTGSSYILADHTKLGKNSSFVSCSLNNIQNIVTDELANPIIVNALRESGIHVHQVSKNDIF